MKWMACWHGSCSPSRRRGLGLRGLPTGSAICCCLVESPSVCIVITADRRPSWVSLFWSAPFSRDSRATNLNSVLPGIGADSAAIASQVSVIDSTDLLRKVFDDENLGEDPEFAGGGLLSSITGALWGGGSHSDDAVFEGFRKHVSVEREGLTYVIDVSVQLHDPEKAARIAQAIVGAYRASLEGQNEAANTKVNDLLTGRITGLQAAVGDAERAVQDFKYKHRIFDASSGGTLQSQTDQLTTQLVAAQDQADQAESKYDQAVAAGTGPDGLNKLAEIVNSNTTDKLRQDYNQRAAALANAESTYGPKHPTIVRMQAELGRIRGLMALEAQRITRELKASRDIAAENVNVPSASTVSVSLPPSPISRRNTSPLPTRPVTAPPMLCERPPSYASYSVPPRTRRRRRRSRRR